MMKKVLAAAIVFIVLMYIAISMFGKNNTIGKYAVATDMQEIKPVDIPEGKTGNDSKYTYSMWIYIDDWNYKFGDKKVILIRKDPSSPPHYPKIYLGEYNNDLTISMTCLPNDINSSSTNEECTINNVPIQSWVHIAISVFGRTMDTYMDGKLARTCVFDGLPVTPSTSSSILITPDGGFSGYTAGVQYFPDAKNPYEIYNIYKKGYNGTSGMFESIFGRYTVKVKIVDKTAKQTA